MLSPPTVSVPDMIGSGASQEHDRPVECHGAIAALKIDRVDRYVQGPPARAAEDSAHEHQHSYGGGSFRNGHQRAKGGATSWK